MLDTRLLANSMRHGFLWCPVVLVVALSACATGTQNTASGTRPVILRGEIRGVGGPAPSQGRLLAGTVVVKSGSKVLHEQTVAEGVSYRFSLAPGHYRLSVKDNTACTAAADLKDSANARVDVVCQLK